MTFTKRRSRSNRSILLFQLKVFRNEKMELVLFVHSALSGDHSGLFLVAAIRCNRTRPHDQTAPRVEGEKAGAASDERSATNSIAGDVDSEHGHIPGAHGGIMISLGRDSYHVEAVIDSSGCCSALHAWQG